MQHHILSVHPEPLMVRDVPQDGESKLEAPGITLDFCKFFIFFPIKTLRLCVGCGLFTGQSAISLNFL